MSRDPIGSTDSWAHAKVRRRWYRKSPFESWTVPEFLHCVRILGSEKNALSSVETEVKNWKVLPSIIDYSEASWFGELRALRKQNIPFNATGFQTLGKQHYSK